MIRGLLLLRNIVYGLIEEVYLYILNKVFSFFHFIQSRFFINKNPIEPITEQILSSPAWNTSFVSNIYGYIGQIQIVKGKNYEFQFLISLKKSPIVNRWSSLVNIYTKSRFCL